MLRCAFEKVLLRDSSAFIWQMSSLAKLSICCCSGSLLCQDKQTECLLTRLHELFTMKESVMKYSQTSVFEHNPFQKAVRKAICSKTETIFSIRINVNNFNPFQV